MGTPLISKVATRSPPQRLINLKLKKPSGQTTIGDGVSWLAD